MHHFRKVFQLLLICGAAVAVLALTGAPTPAAAQTQATDGRANLNFLGEHSVVDAGNLHYFAEPGATEIQVLDANRDVLRRLKVTDAVGHAVPVYALHFDPATGTLIIANSAKEHADLYAVDTENGRATYRTRAGGNLRQAMEMAAHVRPVQDAMRPVMTTEHLQYNLPGHVTIEPRSARHSPLPAGYADEKANRLRTAGGTLDAVVASKCNSLVCVRIDEDGDFDMGTPDGRSLLYYYTAVDPITTDIRVSIDGAIYNLTPEVGIGCDGTANFVSWTDDGTSLRVYYTIGDLFEVEVIHTPVLFSATTGAILTRTVVTNNDDASHNIGVLYQYDTTVDGDDAAELYLGPNHLLVETCYDAPFSSNYWDAIPASGTLVGRSTFTGGDAVTPDHLAFGQWGDYYYGVCWNRVCAGAPYGDSAVLYQWDEDPVPGGGEREVATYYGVGESIIAAGELQISAVQPSLTCRPEYGVEPDPFQLLVNVTNTGDADCHNVNVTVTDGSGPGGTGTIIGDYTQTIPTLAPGNNAAVSFTVDLEAMAAGGCLYFNINVTSDNCEDNQIEDFCVNVPECIPPEPGHISFTFDAPTFTCENGVLTPNPATVTWHLENTGGMVCNDVQLSFSGGMGPGGTATMNTPSPVMLGDMAPGATAEIPFEFAITPSGNPGCITFSGFLSSSCGALFIDFICIDVPACTGSPGDCGCMDLVFAVDVTGSMGGAIGNVAAELPNIVTAARNATGGDVRFGVVTFHDEVHVLHNFIFDHTLISTTLNGLTAGGGWNEPEASNQALQEVITQDATCTDGSQFTTDFRPTCVKVIVLVTDARPGTCDDDYTPGVDDVDAHQRALDAQSRNILLSAVYVPTWMDFEGQIIPIMQDYASTTGGQYTQVNSDGSGTGLAIQNIIENCGEAEQPDDCDGPHCNAQPAVGYTALSGMVADAAMSMTPDNKLQLTWTAQNGVDYYQVYMGTEFDSPFNWSPVGAAFENRFELPDEVMNTVDSNTPVYFYVKAKEVATNLLDADLACWPMDEGAGTLVEDFGQDNDGTIHGADWVPGTGGHWGLHFEYGDYVQVANDVEFYGQPLQVDACVTIHSYPTIQTGSYYIFSCHRYATWFQGFGLRVDVNGRLLSEVWNEDIHNWNTLWANPAYQVPLDVPFHVTAVINGDDSFLLLNGGVVAAGTQDYNSITNGFNMTIGAHNYNDGRYQYHMRGEIHWLKVSQFPLN